MKVKLFKRKNTETIYTARKVDDQGNKVEFVALIGKVWELFKKDIVTEAPPGTAEKWLIVYPDGSVSPHENLMSAAVFVGVDLNDLPKHP